MHIKFHDTQCVSTQNVSHKQMIFEFHLINTSTFLHVNKLLNVHFI